AVPGLADTSKRSRVKDPERRGRAMSESSNSESSSNSDSDDDSDSDSHSSSSGSSGDDESFSSSTEGSGSDETRSGDELTLFEIAKARGLVNERVDNKKEEEEEEVAPVGPPPRPPIVRSFPNNVDLALQRYEERLNREENMIRIKDDNKAVSLGTSKVNYIDPRIVCSWAKEYNVPIGKIFSATLQKKFPWAMGAENFSF
ncbi:type IB topoisomerase small subunit, partial [Trypanosoma cruzi]